MYCFICCIVFFLHFSLFFISRWMRYERFSSSLCHHRDVPTYVYIWTTPCTSLTPFSFSHLDFIISTLFLFLRFNVLFFAFILNCNPHQKKYKNIHTWRRRHKRMAVCQRSRSTHMRKLKMYLNETKKIQNKTKHQRVVYVNYLYTKYFNEIISERAAGDAEQTKNHWLDEDHLPYWSILRDENFILKFTF